MPGTGQNADLFMKNIYFKNFLLRSFPRTALNIRYYTVNPASHHRFLTERSRISTLDHFRVPLSQIIFQCIGIVSAKNVQCMLQTIMCNSSRAVCVHYKQCLAALLQIPLFTPSEYKVGNYTAYIHTYRQYARWDTVIEEG